MIFYFNFYVLKFELNVPSSFSKGLVNIGSEGKMETIVNLDIIL